MARFIVIDPTVNAYCGAYEAPNAAAALDAVAQRMGWTDYADYLAGAAKHSGVRTLQAHAVEAISKAA